MSLDPALHDFGNLVRAAEIDLAGAALAVARIEHPDLIPEPSLERLDELARRSAATKVGDRRRALQRMCGFLFDEVGFRGNADDYYDPRNSCLNDVLDRRLGIPITLSVLVMEVGRRVGLEIQGIGLPGHFCVGARVDDEVMLLDPFGGGRRLERAEAEAIASRAVGRQVELTDAHFAPPGLTSRSSDWFARRPPWPLRLCAPPFVTVQIEERNKARVRYRSSPWSIFSIIGGEGGIRTLDTALDRITV